MAKTRIVLASGGIDSTLAWHKIGGIPVFIDLGQPYADKERLAVRRLFGNRLVEMTIDNLIDSEAANPFIPARNLFLASYIVMRFNADEIYMGGLKDDNVVDKTPDAFRRMSEILSSFAKKPVQVLSPFWQQTKGEIVADFLAAGGDPQRLLDCVSCYERAVPGHCGRCPACFRRWVALTTNGIEGISIDRDILSGYLARLHCYDEDRRSRILIAARPLFAGLSAYDIDGTLTEKTAGYGAAYAGRTPRLDMIARLNRDYDNGHLVIIYTARLGCDRAVTEEWLRRHGVRHHSLITNKLPFDRLYDDRAAVMA